jgi:Zn-dependent peptidase ImmA (M78 family)
MGTFPAVPFISIDSMRIRVNDMLDELHPSGQLPIPVERLVQKVGIELVLMPGIEKVLNCCAYVTQELSEIVIDEHTFTHNRRRARFSTGHEYGHAFLHRLIYRSLTYNSLDEYFAVMGSIPEDSRRRLELQANDFAGLVLVPRHALVSSLAEVRAKAAAVGLDAELDTREAQAFAEEYLTNVFDVSGDVIHRRIEAEGMWKNKTGLTNANW